MVTVHNTAQERQTRLAMSLDLKSEVSPLSTQLGEDAKSLMSELEAAGAAEFDALYLRSQVDGHMKVLMLINERLLPSVMADELRDELMLARMEVATHLEGARNASTSLDDTDAGTP
jgi:putative membrane protein